MILSGVDCANRGVLARVQARTVTPESRARGGKMNAPTEEERTAAGKRRERSGLYKEKGQDREARKGTILSRLLLPCYAHTRSSRCIPAGARDANLIDIRTAHEMTSRARRRRRTTNRKRRGRRNERGWRKERREEEVGGSQIGIGAACPVVVGCYAFSVKYGCCSASMAEMRVFWSYASIFEMRS